MKSCPQCSQRYPTDSTFCFVDGSTLVAAKDPRVGSTIAGRYVLEEVVGEGGMAIVYKARHKLVDRPCAVKVLNLAYAADPTVRERFRREARHAQRLAHPNIIEIFDQGDTEDGASFLVMELLEGKSLADTIAAGPLSLERALPIFVQMTRALARAHDFEVIHRDLKPENVFLMSGDFVKLLDFGIARCMQDARLTSMGEIFGTPQYMAPERGTSIDAGPAADLYGLGVIFFETLSQKLPFDAPDAATLLVKHMREPQPHLKQLVRDVPDALDKLVYELMAKKPEERPIDAHRVLHDLTALADRFGIPLPPEPEGILEVRSAPLRAGGLDRWGRRAELFERMLGTGFGANAPPDLRRMLDSVKSHVKEITELRSRALGEEQKLEQLDHEAREGRLRFGRAMDALSVDASKIRQEARTLRAAVTPLHEATVGFPPLLIAASKQVIIWEGRSGFAEPSGELIAAYRAAAEIVERWQGVRAAELVAQQAAVEKERAVGDVDYQIKELRAGLETLDKSMNEKRLDSRRGISEMGQRAETLEAELVNLATRFCGPLRAKPELGQLFRELETEATRRA